jgi:hypothetical protein
MIDIFNLKFIGKSISGEVLVGSLITLHLPNGDEYYIYDGYPQKHSGYYHILRNCRVIKESIRLVGAEE